jgi:hypothetical protein
VGGGSPSPTSGGATFIVEVPRAPKGSWLTADAGGSNGYRARAWKSELQDLTDETGLRIHVCHFPPGTSKWNKIEHRLFCHITQNWRGKPLTSSVAVVNLIGSTRTRKGLRVKAQLDKNHYPTGVEITKADMKRLALQRDELHGDWNHGFDPERLTESPVAGLRIRGARLRCSDFDVHSHAFVLAPWRACVSLTGSVRFCQALLFTVRLARDEAVKQ